MSTMAPIISIKICCGRIEELCCNCTLGRRPYHGVAMFVFRAVTARAPFVKCVTVGWEALQVQGTRVFISHHILLVPHSSLLTFAPSQTKTVIAKVCSRWHPWRISSTVYDRNSRHTIDRLEEGGRSTCRLIRYP